MSNIKSIIAIHDDGTYTAVSHGTEGTVVTGTSAVGINPATGQPMTSRPGYVSELESLLLGVQSSTRGENTVTTDTPEKRQQFQLMPGSHSFIDAPKGRTIYELLRGPDGAESQIHIAGAGYFRVELAGSVSGTVVGGAQVGVDQEPPGVSMEGNLDSFRREVVAKSSVEVYLRLDGGDQKVLLVVTPL